MTDTLGALEEHLPKSVGPCEPGNLRPATQGSIYASVICHPTGAPVLDLQYMTMHDSIALRDLFHGQLIQYQIDVASGPDASAVCDKRPHGAFRWYAQASGDPMLGAVMHAFDRQPGSTQGRAVCYIAGDRAWLDWIDPDTHIYAFASTSIEDYPALFHWWRDEAGPYHPRHQPTPTSASPSGMEPTGGASM
ncbi:MAG: hypothetical protein M3P43_16350 [Actinomycetota bacterium]|nr:hypothetical protein [Actinomycetota bacterium]